MSEATAARDYFDPRDPDPTCDICEEKQFCCGDPWCSGEDWDAERGWHQLCYERAIEELEDEVNTLPDGVGDVERIKYLMTLLGVELEVKKK